jgi:hypothetical protein
MSQPGKIYSLIPKIMTEVGAIEKLRSAASGGGNSYKFRGIDDVYMAFHPALSRLGVFCAPTVIKSEREERQSNAGKAITYSIMHVQFKFFAEDGSYIEVVTVGEAMDSSDKSSNKAMSAAMKYAFLQVFCIPTEEDNDTENTHHEPLPRPTPTSLAPRVSPVQRPHSTSGDPAGSGAFCDTCRTELVLSKAGNAYFCPRFKESELGDHTRFLADQLQGVINQQTQAKMAVR